jgi:hypothetical protein
MVKVPVKDGIKPGCDGINGGGVASEGINPGKVLDGMSSGICSVKDIGGG